MESDFLQDTILIVQKRKYLRNALCKFSFPGVPFDYGCPRDSPAKFMEQNAIPWIRGTPAVRDSTV